MLFTIQRPLMAALRKRSGVAAVPVDDPAGRPPAMGLLLFQFLVGVYGGYFGAGIGILMLAALSMVGHTDIHRMNALKSLLALAINGIAALYFIASGLVVWNDAVVMAVGAIAGGVGGAGAARRAGRETVHRLIVIIGFGMAAALMFKP